MAIFRGRKGRDDTFTGTDASDTFVFDPADLTSADTIFGGDGSAIDVLRFTAAGTIPAAALAGVSGIERIELGEGGSRLELTQTLVDTTGVNPLTVVGGSGDDQIDASQITSSESTLAYLRLEGGAGDDVIVGSGGMFTSTDGGGGADRITLSRGSTVYDANDIFEKASGSGILRLYGAATIDLSQTSDQSLDDTCIVQGFSRVDAARSREAVFVKGTGKGEIHGGSGSDRLENATFITGGRGADILTGSSSGTSFLLGLAISFAAR